jgi:lycopene cyclase domain-containing protein
MKTLYLWIDLLSFIPPFLFSFHPKLQLHKNWKSLIPSILLTAFAFILWDAYYTYLGVWGFNPTYLIGFYVGNLPIEEILFFICIPYACIYSYHCFKALMKSNPLFRVQRIVSCSIILFCSVFAIWHFDKLYTNVAFILLILVILFFEFIAKANWLSLFYFAYLFLLIPFLLVNGILTGTGIDAPIVWYNPAEFVGFRILTIPFEDIFYGMSMLLCSTGIYEYLLTQKLKRH